MDIGCYPIQISRFLFEREPLHVAGAVERDPTMGVDRLTSALLDFGVGHAVFTCGTQMTPYQRVQVIGTQRRIDVEIPFNAPPDKPARIFIDDGKGLTGASAVAETFAVCDQYTLQGDAFSKAIREGGEVPTPLEDSVANMQVIDAIFASAARR